MYILHILTRPMAALCFLFIQLLCCGFGYGQAAGDSLLVEKIFFANMPSTGNADIYRMNNDGTGCVKVVISPGNEFGPSLSPDKTKIAFYRHIDNNTWSEFIMNANGTGITQLTNTPNVLDSKPSWSPDGKRIAFGRMYPLESYRSELWLMNSDGSNLHRIGTFNGNGPSFSPNGVILAFESLVSNTYQICTADTNGANFRRLTSAGTQNSWPAYSPDGQRIAFESNRDGIPEIYIMKADGTNPFRLTVDTLQNADVCWSPDGRAVAFTTLSMNKYDIHTIKADGTGLTKITSMAGNNIQPQWTTVKIPFPKYLGQTPPDTIPKRFGSPDMWSDGVWWWHGPPSFSPDGKEMYFVKYNSSKPAGYMEMYYMKIKDGAWIGPLRPSFASDSCDNSPIFSPDGNTLFFVSNRSGTLMVYKVTRTDTGWSVPSTVEVAYQNIPNGTLGWNINFTNSNSMYFTIYRNSKTSINDYLIARAKQLNGVYSVFEELPQIINSSLREAFGYIEPDEKYIIFESIRNSGLGYHDLYISFKDESGSWLPPKNLGSRINGQYEDAFPMLSPDGKYLFFNSAKTGDYGYNAYWVDAKILDQFKPSVDAERTSPTQPSGFELKQNYPNPFNPTTQLRFSIPQAAFVSLKVFDMIGRQAAVLEEGELSAGTHSYTFDGAGLASGVYFYSLRCGREIVTGKMLLQK